LAALERADEDYDAYKDAMEQFSIAIKENPKNAEFYSYRGDAYTNLGKYDEALKDFTQAIKLSAKNASIYSKRGFVYYALDDNKSSGKA
jgi:Flp pilus assembly protein TadD